MKDGYTGGIKDFSVHHTVDNGLLISGGGHALIDQNDIGTELLLSKDGLGSMALDFSEFRKYYDNTGGTGRLFVDGAIMPRT